MKNIRHYKDNIKRKVLVVENDLKYQSFFADAIKEEFETIFCNDSQELLHRLKHDRTKYSLVAVDIDLPEIDGCELFPIISNDPNYKNIPIIILIKDAKDVLRSLEIGASDFISKPFDPANLVLTRVKRAVMLAEQSDIISRTERDALTGLIGKQYLYEFINEYEKYYPDSQMDAIAVSIKKFRATNAMLGHEFGDRLLVNVANAINQIMEQYGGIASRVESDTFFLYLASHENYEEIIINKLEEVTAELDKVYHINFKVGIYHNVDKSQSIEKRFDDAMRALRRNDDSLKSTFVVFNKGMHEKELFEEKLVLEFDKSIKEKQFHVYLQPKMDISGDEPRLTSAEALVRWVHPEHGIISPITFIPLFEKNGLIQKLDAFIWNEAASQVRKWKDEYGINLPISINVSRVDLFNNKLADELHDILKRNNISMNELFLEVTESAVVSDTSEILKNVKILKEKGFIIEMDDFGTGYSSMHMVSTLPLDALKIDMVFISNLLSSEKDKRMVQIILEIAKLLNAKTIAEGVENKEQLDLLKEMGIDMVQGYYFSKPLPISEFNKKYFENKLNLSEFK